MQDQQCMHCALGSTDHRIINDRIEKYESYIVFSQSRIAAMKNEESTALSHPLTTPIPHARPGVGNGGGRRMHQGNISPANSTTMVEMQSNPLPLSPIRLPFD